MCKLSLDLSYRHIDVKRSVLSSSKVHINAPFSTFILPLPTAFVRNYQTMKCVQIHFRLKKVASSRREDRSWLTDPGRRNQLPMESFKGPRAPRIEGQLSYFGRNKRFARFDYKLRHIYEQRLGERHPGQETDREHGEDALRRRHFDNWKPMRRQWEGFRGKNQPFRPTFRP